MSIPGIDAQHESARFSIPIVTRRNADGLIIDAVKDIVDAQRHAPVRIELIAGAQVDHSEGALHLPEVLRRHQAIAKFIQSSAKKTGIKVAALGLNATAD